MCMEYPMFTVADGILDPSAEEHLAANTENAEAVSNYASNGCGIELTHTQCGEILTICKVWIDNVKRGLGGDYTYMVEKPLSYTDDND